MGVKAHLNAAKIKFGPAAHRTEQWEVDGGKGAIVVHL
jgi:hypothetical protein